LVGVPSGADEQCSSSYAPRLHLEMLRSMLVLLGGIDECDLLVVHLATSFLGEASAHE
jgi:hypothetical protein